jgi:hypothetical protein
MSERDRREPPRLPSEEDVLAALAELIGGDPAPDRNAAKQIEEIAQLLGQHR